MAVFVKSCQVCAREDVRKVVDAMLLDTKQKFTLKQIAAAIGNVSSKTSIYRHKSKCLIRIEAARVAATKMQAGDSVLPVFVDYPSREQIERITLAEERDKESNRRTWLLLVAYEPAMAPRPVKPLPLPEHQIAAVESTPN